MSRENRAKSLAGTALTRCHFETENKCEQLCADIVQLKYKSHTSPKIKEMLFLDSMVLLKAV